MFGVDLIPEFDAKNKSLKVGTQYESGWVVLRVQGEDERLVVTLVQGEGSNVLHGRKGVENRAFVNPSLYGMHIPRDEQFMGGGGNGHTEGLEDPAVHSVWGGRPRVVPVNGYTQTPAWPAQLHKFLFPIEAKVDRGYVRDVHEVGGCFWEVV